MKKRIINIIIIILIIANFWYVFRGRIAPIIWYYKWKINSKIKARYIYNQIIQKEKLRKGEFR